MVWLQLHDIHRPPSDHPFVHLVWQHRMDTLLRGHENCCLLSKRLNRCKAKGRDGECKSSRYFNSQPNSKAASQISVLNKHATTNRQVCKMRFRDGTKQRNVLCRSKYSPATTNIKPMTICACYKTSLHEYKHEYLLTCYKTSLHRVELQRCLRRLDHVVT